MLDYCNTILVGLPHSTIDPLQGVLNSVPIVREITSLNHWWTCIGWQSKHRSSSNSACWCTRRSTSVHHWHDSTSDTSHQSLISHQQPLNCFLYSTVSQWERNWNLTSTFSALTYFMLKNCFSICKCIADQFYAESSNYIFQHTLPPSSSTWPHLSYSLVRSKRKYYHNCSLVVLLCSFL